MTLPTEPIGSIPRPLRLIEAVAAVGFVADDEHVVGANLVAIHSFSRRFFAIEEDCRPRKRPRGVELARAGAKVPDEQPNVTLAHEGRTNEAMKFKEDASVAHFTATASGDRP